MAERCQARAATTRRAGASRRPRPGAQILDAAQRLFERTATRRRRWRRSRREAGVALKTVYVAFETKSGLLRALWHLLLRGDEDDAPVGERRWYREVLDEPDPERQLRLNARNSRRVKERVGRLLERDPRRRAGRPRHRRALGADPDATSTRTSARSSSARSRQAGAPRRPRRRRAAPTSSGRSTTRTCGSCSSASAAGRRSVTSSGSATRSASSCSASEAELAARDDDRGAADEHALDPLGAALGPRVERRGPADLGALRDLDLLAERDPAVAGEVDRRAGRRPIRSPGPRRRRAPARTCASSSRRPSRAKQLTPSRRRRARARRCRARAPRPPRAIRARRRRARGRCRSARPGAPSRATPSAASRSAARPRPAPSSGSAAPSSRRRSRAPSRSSSTGTTPAPVSSRITIFCSGPPSTNARRASDGRRTAARPPA